eukprot:scaffold57151_cov62-Phaeocystis_antarctica.AAC.1
MNHSRACTAANAQSELTGSSIISMLTQQSEESIVPATGVEEEQKRNGQVPAGAPQQYDPLLAVRADGGVV